MMLFYGEGLRRESHARADRIEEINIGMNSGKKAQEIVRKLRNR